MAKIATRRLVECVPNFSEGRNEVVINKIAAAIKSIKGVHLLHKDIGYDAARTVITFAGELESVLEAAFQGVAAAAELIDMRCHHGTHPRLGATDVLPLIPLSGISLEECAEHARALAERISRELLIPTYCYAAAALKPERYGLERCRRGEYEALPERLLDPHEAPDFGARPFDDIIARSGAINVGARNFLIAVNFNLSTKDVTIAKAIATKVRASGGVVRCGTTEQRVAGLLPECKAIGWWVEEYGFAQVSTNLTNISVTPLHKAFEQICQTAQQHGVEVIGTEIIGLVPRRVLIEAGRHFCPNAASATEAIAVAIERMGLSTITEFRPEERIIDELITI